jgi:Ribonuclease G/E
MKSDRSPACLYQEPDLVERTVRDFLTEEVDRVLIDDKASLRAHPGSGRPDLQTLARQDRLLQGQHPDLRALQHRAPDRADRPAQGRPPFGGEIIIDETEALIAIDVNTGSHKNRGGDEKNVIYAVNLEAAVRGRPPDPAPQPRRPDHHRLHRHEGAPPPQRHLRADGRGDVARQSQEPHPAHLDSSASCR